MLKKYQKLSIVAKASLWAFIANIIQRGVTILATPIFTRILTTSQYAQYTLYQSWHDIFIIFTSLNVFNYATYSGLAKYDEDKEGFIATAQSLVTGLTLLCFVLYFIINIIKNNIIGFPLPIVILLFFDMLAFAVFNLWASKERYNFKYKLVTFASIIIGIMGPILGLLAIKYIPNKGYGRIYGVATINIIIGLIVYIYNYSKSKNRFNKKYIKFILIYCIPLIPHFLATQVLTRFDRIMINDMCGASQAGIYSLAYSLSSLLIIVNDAILKSLTPLTYKTIKNNKGLSSLKQNANFLIILVAILNILLILFAPEAVKIFAPKEYFEAIYIIPAITGSVYFMFLFNLFANIEYYYSETKYVTIASLMAAIVNIVTNLIFIKLFGYLAAGYTTLISYILYAVGHFIFMKKIVKKHAPGVSYYDDKKIFLISLGFVIISLLIIPLYKFYLMRYLIIVIIVSIIFIKRKEIINKIYIKN